MREILRVDPDLRRMLRDGQKKDASLDPATLAWVISQLTIAPGARLPFGVDPAALDAFRRDLVGRLEELAFERASGGGNP